MKTATRTEIDTELRDEWLRTLDALQNQIAEWVRQEPGWTLEEVETKEIEEAVLGRYTVSVGSILTPQGEVRLEPLARNYPGRGIVELYAWPTLRRVRLLTSDTAGEWRVRVDSGFNLRQPWDRLHFVLLVNDLIGAEDLTAAA
jgi:hypothetical protein